VIQENWGKGNIQYVGIHILQIIDLIITNHISNLFHVNTDCETHYLTGRTVIQLANLSGSPYTVIV